MKIDWIETDPAIIPHGIPCGSLAELANAKEYENLYLLGKIYDTLLFIKRNGQYDYLPTVIENGKIIKFSVRTLGGIIKFIQNFEKSVNTKGAYDTSTQAQIVLAQRWLNPVLEWWRDSGGLLRVDKKEPNLIHLNMGRLQVKLFIILDSGFIAFRVKTFNRAKTLDTAQKVKTYLSQLATQKVKP